MHESARTALQDQISRNFSDLSPQLRRAARYVSEHPEDVAMRSLRQVAKTSGLNPPTYSRLARAIGFQHYEDLRDSCRNELRQQRLSLADRAALLQESDGSSAKSSAGSFAAAHARSAVSGIQKLIDDLNVSQLAVAADQLAKAENVFLIGSMSSRTMVEYLSYVAHMATSNWRVIGQGADSASVLLAGITERDVVLTVAIAPFASETVRAVEIAAAADACILAVTDDLQSPVLKHARFSFFIPTESPQFFPSQVAVVTFLEILIGMVVRRLGDKCQNRIDAVEKINHAIGDYWPQ
jgi:DNA-binding MurR/RpiR family transcriptional regulator